MTANRDPRTMSREELLAYFDHGGDLSELLRDATVGPDLGPAPAPETIPMIVTGVRLSSATVRRLDELAGNDRGGRSGLIRQAIDEFLARHSGEAA
ncbi:ribbon-helix-helix protein, CopG family [Micromonospora cathayae]|uniref:Ribbon-helix-helix protein, CopG family n=1 Tax=Micromonospora cathayae TaxID=3028804 RepID=A0ABY7ZH26_9ACTN|nr:ribbon-helix-helix protein, CopG family [Micromonospora sp. HUAS 3]WDZ82225.1 ribbon-helix-helix protein, CopG family [Micromonospora sp. HUAS 3]